MSKGFVQEVGPGLEIESMDEAKGHVSGNASLPSMTHV